MLLDQHNQLIVIECCGQHFENKMEMYCCEFENTKDGSQNFKPDNILNRQLIFTRFLTPYQRENYRWIKCPTEANHSQNEIVDDFEIKFGVNCEWEESKDESGRVWSAWVIHELNKETAPKDDLAGSRQ